MILGVSVAGVAVWYQMPRHISMYTDADTIRVAATEAAPRDILWQPPVPLSEVLNTEEEDYEPRMSWDGLTLYFVRGKAGQNAELYWSRRTPSGWTDPLPLVEINSPSDDLGPEPSADGTALYFYSDREGGLGGYDLWMSRYVDGRWEPPVNLGASVNSEYNDYGPALTPNGHMLYFTSNRPHPSDVTQPNPDAWPATVREDLFYRTYDLYQARISERGIGEAEAVEGLNTPYNDGPACVSPAGDFLYFSSDRPEGKGGFDLWRARLVSGMPQVPENLRAPVNTFANELDPALTALGYGLYFSSDRMADARGRETIADDYNLYYSESREVFRDRESVARAAIDWASLWDGFGRNLLWALLALLVLLLLLTWGRGVSEGRMSLLTRCLLASVMLHLLLMFLLNTWKVTTGVLTAMRDRGEIKVALLAPSSGGAIESQFRTETADIDLEAAMPPSVDRPDIQPANSVPSRRGEFDLVSMSVPASRPINAKMDLEMAMPEMEDPFHERAPWKVPTATAMIVELPNSAAPVDVSEPTRHKPAPVEGIVFERPAPTPVSVNSVAKQRLVETEFMASAESGRTERIPPYEMSMRVSDQADVAWAMRVPLAQRPPPATTAVNLPHVPVTTPNVDVQESPMAVSARWERIDRKVPSPTFDAQASSPRYNVKIDDRHRENPSEFAAAEMIIADDVPAASHDTLLPTRESRLLRIDDLPDRTLSDLDVPPVRRGRPADDEPARHAAAAPLDIDRPIVKEPSVMADAGQYSIALLRNTEHTDTIRLPSELQSSKAADASPAIAKAMPLKPSLSPPPPQMMNDVRFPEGAEPEREAPALSPANASLSITLEPEHPSRDPREWNYASTKGSQDLVRIDTSHADHRHRDQGLGSLMPDANGTEAATVSEHDLSAPSIAVASLTPQPSLDLRMPSPISEEWDDPYAQRELAHREAIVERMGGTAETEASVERALRWLATHQSEDGRWDGDAFDTVCGECGGETTYEVDTGLTGLALLCFLGAGHTHVTPGPYQDNVARGLSWLLQRQSASGDLRGGETMYSQGIAALALSEVYGMSGDSALADPLRRAIEFIIQAQNRQTGGWRYEPGDDGDTSVFGWQILALKSAEATGMAVPGETFMRAKHWLRLVESSTPRGRYAYRPGEAPSPAMTAEAMLVQQLLGSPHDDRDLASSAQFVGGFRPDWDQHVNTYQWYYTTLALFHYQGDPWLQWNEALQRELIDRQEREGRRDGSWPPEGDWAHVGGRVYQTALCTLMLEIYYRYLPQYLIDRDADAFGIITGTVTREATADPLSGATVRLDLGQAKGISATTSLEGRYELVIPEVPDFFAVSASRPGYVPQSKNVSANAVHGRTLVLDFSLEPDSELTLVVEAVPDVHHLGNDRFEGQINSQFQKESEGRTFTAVIELDEAQLASMSRRPRLTLLAKGVQCPHEVYVNGKELRRRLDRSPSDGSFGEISLPVDRSLLQAGSNEIMIRAVTCQGDLDDFEFVNLQLDLGE